MNRIISDKVRSILSSSKPSLNFWAEAAHTVLYLINRILTLAIGFKVPLEKWIVHLVKLANLRVFGCLAYAHAKDDKLKPKAIKCSF